MRRLTLAVSMLVIAVGCGDIYADPQTPSGTEMDAGALSPMVNPTVCPTARPRENSPCDAFGSSCEYGTSADDQCNVVLSCRGSSGKGYWEASVREGCMAKACPAAADVALLADRPCSLLEADGGVTTDSDEAICNVSDGVCACTTGPSGTAHERRWVCTRPIAMCPTSRPLAGHPCNGELWCDYGSCDAKRGFLMECKDGTWLAGGNACP